MHEVGRACLYHSASLTGFIGGLFGTRFGQVGHHSMLLPLIIRRTNCMIQQQKPFLNVTESTATFSMCT